MFGKSQFRNEKGEIDLSKIERKVKESSSLVQRYKIGGIYYVKNLLLSEAVKIIEYYKTGARKEMYDTELISEIYVGTGFFNRDKHYCTVGIIPKSFVKHI